MPLTWRNVAAPDYRGSMEGYEAASRILSRAIGDIRTGINDFSQARTDAADRAAIAESLTYTDADAFQRDLASGSLDLRGMSSEGLAQISRRPSDLLRQQVVSQQLESDAYDLGRRRTTHDREDAAREPAARYLSLMESGNFDEARNLLNTSPELQGMSVEGIQNLVSRGQDTASARQQFDITAYGQDRAVIRDERADADYDSTQNATRLFQQIDATSASPKDAQNQLRELRGELDAQTYGKLTQMIEASYGAVTGPLAMDSEDPVLFSDPRDTAAVHEARSHLDGVLLTDLGEISSSFVAELPTLMTDSRSDGVIAAEIEESNEFPGATRRQILSALEQIKGMSERDPYNTDYRPMTSAEAASILRYSIASSGSGPLMRALSGPGATSFPLVTGVIPGIIASTSDSDSRELGEIGWDANKARQMVRYRDSTGREDRLVRSRQVREQEAQIIRATEQMEQAEVQYQAIRQAASNNPDMVAALGRANEERERARLNLAAVNALYRRMNDNPDSDVPQDPDRSRMGTDLNPRIDDVLLGR